MCASLNLQFKAINVYNELPTNDVTKLNDYKVCTACNGKEAVEVLKSKEIDLVISDIMMPEMDGIELCKYIKETSELCHIPVILLTAKHSVDDVVDGYGSGADCSWSS